MTDPRIDLPPEEAPAGDAGRLIDLDPPPETPSTDPGATGVDLDKGQQLTDIPAP